MESLWPRSVLLCLLATALVACASLSSSPGRSEATELSQLPDESRIYLRHQITVLARTNRVSLLSGFEPEGVKAELSLLASPLDRYIGSSTPFLIEGIDRSARTSAYDDCQVVLHLRSSHGTALTLSASRSVASVNCSPLTIEDLATVAIIVPSPQRPIQ